MESVVSSGAGCVMLLHSSSLSKDLQLSQRETILWENRTIMALRAKIDEHLLKYLNFYM